MQSPESQLPNRLAALRVDRYSLSIMGELRPGIFVHSLMSGVLLSLVLTLQPPQLASGSNCSSCCCVESEKSMQCLGNSVAIKNYYFQEGLLRRITDRSTAKDVRSDALQDLCR